MTTRVPRYIRRVITTLKIASRPGGTTAVTTAPLARLMQIAEQEEADPIRSTYHDLSIRFSSRQEETICAAAKELLRKINSSGKTNFPPAVRFSRILQRPDLRDLADALKTASTQNPRRRRPITLAEILTLAGKSTPDKEVIQKCADFARATESLEDLYRLTQCLLGRDNPYSWNVENAPRRAEALLAVCKAQPKAIPYVLSPVKAAIQPFGLQINPVHLQILSRLAIDHPEQAANILDWLISKTYVAPRHEFGPPLLAIAHAIPQAFNAIHLNVLDEIRRFRPNQLMDNLWVYKQRLDTGSPVPEPEDSVRSDCRESQERLLKELGILQLLGI